MTWIYVRVSTKEQAKEGFSIEAQTEKCLRYARAHGLVLGDNSNCGTNGAFVDGGQSATKKKQLSDRPGGMRLLSCIRQGDHVVVTSPHRLFRSLMHSEVQLNVWDKADVTLHFVDHSIRSDSPNGRLLLQMMFSIAEWKRRILSSRIKEGQAWYRINKGRKNNTIEKTSAQVGYTEIFPDEKSVGPEDPISQAHLHMYYRSLEQEPFSGTLRAYIRVSRASQNIEVQRELIKRWQEHSPEYKDAKIVWYVDHGESAFTQSLGKRKAGKDMLSDLRKGDLVIAARADRITRSLGDITHILETFRSRGAHALILDCNLKTDTVFGQMMLHMLGLVASMESHEMGLSLNAGVAVSVALKGVHTSTIPVMLRPKHFRRLDLNHKSSGNQWGRHPVLIKALLSDDQWAWAVAMFWAGSNATGVPSRIARGINNYLSDQLGWPRNPFPVGGSGTGNPRATKFTTDKLISLFREKGIDRPEVIEHLRKFPGVAIDGGFIDEHKSGQHFKRLKKRMDVVLQFTDINNGDHCPHLRKVKQYLTEGLDTAMLEKFV